MLRHNRFWVGPLSTKIVERRSLNFTLAMSTDKLVLSDDCPPIHISITRVQLHRKREAQLRPLCSLGLTCERIQFNEEIH